jgi:4'-phosphopantetheinyl transferase
VNAPAGRRHRATGSVWWARPRRGAALLGVLDASERRSAARLARTADRDRYVTAHALLRRVLARRTGVPAAQLQFDRTCRRCGDDHGKPRLRRPRAAVSFNLAHAGDRIVVVVVDGNVDAGVDVERVPGAHAAVLATAGAGVLTVRERSMLQQLPPDGRRRALAVWWTRKEAVLKATGDGLAVPLWAVEVTPPGTAPALLGPVADGRPRRSAAGPSRVDRSTPAGGAPDPPIALRDLRPGPGYAGCVAVRGADAIDLVERGAGTLLHVA